MYKETVNEINENLLDDFIDSDDESRIVLPKSLSDTKKFNVSSSASSQQIIDSKIKIVDISSAPQKKFRPEDFGNEDLKKLKGMGRDAFNEQFPSLNKAVWEKKKPEEEYKEN